MAPPGEQGISIIIVGGGIGGLSFGIEAHRRGHNVRVFERRPEAVESGVAILILNSALHTPQKWPGFMERLQKASLNTRGSFKKWDGTTIAPVTLGHPAAESVIINRGKLHAVLREYAAEQGLSVEYDSAGQEFFETEGQGGVTLTDGRQFTADLVVASDGIGSKSWKLFAGTNTSPVSSGFVVYRVTYPTEDAFKSPVVARELREHKELGLDGGFFFVGPDAHFMSCMAKDETCFTLTCRDHNSDGEETWSKPTSIDNALEAVKDWDPFVLELIKMVPDRTVYDWKMMWRDPQPQWVSTGGHVLQLGDAAHPFLLTSGSGATMALEDAWSLAACLDRAGKDSISLATKVHNKSRFERVSCAQKLGLINREVLHKTDWDAVTKDPELLGKLFQRKWMYDHNPEKYANENYNKCAEHVLKGTPFVNTNHVPGYRYKPWTVHELLEASERGETVEDEGDWL